MTAGDPISVIEPIPPGGCLEIIPPEDVVWMIKNIYFGEAWELYRQKDSNTYMLIASGVDYGLWSNRTFITTKEIHFSIKNISEHTVNFGFDGLVIQ